MDSSIPDPKPSPWVTRALIAAAVVLLALNAFVSRVARRIESGDATSLGDWSSQSAAIVGAALAMAVVVVVVIGGARVTGRAATLASKAKIACWTLVGLLVINSSNVSRAAGLLGGALDGVTDAEREGLKVTADSVTHALLGFTLPITGANVTRSPELERQMMASIGGRRDIVTWIFRDSAKSQMLLIQATKFSRMSETNFRAFATGMRSGLAKATTIDSTLAWRDSVGEFGLHAVQPPGVHILARCLGRLGRPSVVCVETVAADASALEASRVGFALVP